MASHCSFRVFWTERTVVQDLLTEVLHGVERLEPSARRSSSGELAVSRSGIDGNPQQLYHEPLAPHLTARVAVSYRSDQFSLNYLMVWLWHPAQKNVQVVTSIRSGRGRTRGWRRCWGWRGCWGYSASGAEDEAVDDRGELEGGVALQAVAGFLDVNDLGRRQTAE